MESLPALAGMAALAVRAPHQVHTNSGNRDGSTEPVTVSERRGVSVGGACGTVKDHLTRNDGVCCQ